MAITTTGSVLPCSYIHFELHLFVQWASNGTMHWQMDLIISLDKKESIKTIVVSCTAFVEEMLVGNKSFNVEVKESFGYILAPSTC